MNPVLSSIRKFLHLESAGGITLLIAAVAAMAIVNSPLAGWYEAFLDIPVELRFADLHIAKPLLLWINDGLMAVFFFLVGMEIKREVLDGELSNPAQVVLPAVAAAGGILVPALIFTAFNHGDVHAMAGWPIPTATDIAFALGMLALLGNRVPTSLKLFLLTLAIIDDLGAIVIIATLYTGDISTTSLLVAAGALAVLALLNWRGVTRVSAYLLVGTVLWVSVLKSGVHATIAGVLLGFFIPLRSGHEAHESPLRRLEEDLHYPVAFAILPLFAFANAGIPLVGMQLSDLTNSLPLGVALGLFLGKQIGIFSFSWVIIRLGLARLPQGASWASLYGVSVLCGIGFTMSLFIASLAFEGTGEHIVAASRIGIITGTVVSAIAGCLILNWTLPRTAQRNDA